jgi:hypothetical protein
MWQNGGRTRLRDVGRKGITWRRSCRDFAGSKLDDPALNGLAPSVAFQR